MKKEHKAGLIVIALIVLLIIGISSCDAKSAPTSDTSPIVSASALAPTFGFATSTATSSPTPAAVATAKAKAKAKAKARPRRTAVSATANAVAPSPQTTAPAAAPSGCYPLTNGGNCYEPGEFCRNSDHGVSGVAGDGKRIICEDNDGWRWEPV